MSIDLKIGVLGGGQLGRMLLQSAISMDLDVVFMDPDPDAPCKSVTPNFVHGSITDYDSVLNFGQNCDLVTIEIENVNVEALKELRAYGKKVYPQPEAIEIIQDKLLQKEFFKKNDIPTSAFMATKNRQDVFRNDSFLPAVHKLRREGYDGRGVQLLQSEADLIHAFSKPGVLEKMIDIQKEVSVIVGRSHSGEIRAYPAVELVFNPKQNLVEYLFSPAEIDHKTAQNAQAIATKTIEDLGLVGLLAVEMFISQSGELLVNEVAPRTHNSGHHTIESSYTSQFEQHLRAILDLPLGDVGAKNSAVMINILGEEGCQGPARYEGLEPILQIPGAQLHLYGKKICKPYRKMGHVTIVGDDLENLKEKAIFVKNNLRATA